MDQPTETEFGGNGGSQQSPEPWRLPTAYLLITVTGTLFSILAGVYIIFNLGSSVGYVPLETQYFYALLTVLLPSVFILFPFRRGLQAKTSVPFYDALVALSAFGIGVYFTMSGNAIIDEGWEYAAPQAAIYLCYAYWIIVLEALRRTGGTAVFVVAAIFSIYPVIAHLAPGFLEGPANDWSFTAAWHCSIPAVAHSS